MMRSSNGPTSLKLDSDRNLSIRLDNTNSLKNNNRDMMIQVLMNDTGADDEKQQWVDVQRVKKGQSKYKFAAKLCAFYKVKFRVDCNGSSEESKVASFPMKEVIDNIDTRDIVLSLYAHNGHQSDYHPKNLLGDSRYYLSKDNNTFKAQDSDWIVFQMKK